MDCNCKLPDGGCGLVSSLTRHREPVGCAAAALLLRPHARCSHAASSSSAHTALPGQGTPPANPASQVPTPRQGAAPAQGTGIPRPGLSFYLLFSCMFVMFVCLLSKHFAPAPSTRPASRRQQASLPRDRLSVSPSKQHPRCVRSRLRRHSGDITVNRYTLLNASRDWPRLSPEHGAVHAFSP